MKFTCPCCGYPELDRPAYEKLSGPPFRDDVSPPYSIAFGEPSYDVCDCCGFEFGNDDDPGTVKGVSFRAWLQGWVSHGCNWFDPAKKPFDWSLTEQLKPAGIALSTPTTLLPTAPLARQEIAFPDGRTLVRLEVGGTTYDAEEQNRNMFMLDRSGNVLWRVANHESSPDDLYYQRKIPGDPFIGIERKENGEVHGCTWQGWLYKVDLENGSVERIGWTKT